MSNWNTLKKTGLVGLVCFSSIASFNVMAAERRVPPAKKTQQAVSSEQKIRNSIQRADLNDEQKKTALMVFGDMYQTPKGKEIIDNAPVTIRIKDIGTPDGQFSKNENTVFIRKNIFDEIAAAKTDEEIQIAKLRLAGAYALGMTDALQYNQKTTPRQTHTPVEKAFIYKANRLHSLLNSVKVQDQVSSLNSYGPLNLANLEKKNPRLSFFKKLKAAADTLNAFENASLTFADAYWTSNTSVSVAGKTIKANETDMLDWADLTNYHSTGLSFPAFRGEDKNALRVSDKIETMDILAQQMGIKYPSEFIKKASFKITSDGITTYFDGQKRDETTLLSVGVLTQRYRPNGSFQRLFYSPSSGSKSNTGKDVFPGTNITRFTYTIKDGKMNGNLNEFDRKGNQISQIPMKDNIPHGEGWLLQKDGKTLEVWFKNGFAGSVVYEYGMNGKTKLEFR